ncbi:MAG: hypothetical protein JWO40_31 [Candidatus Doudnabacteria bacterium]|nr:hypothetical protein [Candidatus Doudnabacteria bacterium]
MKLINLLPPSEQKVLQQEKLYGGLLRFLIASVVSYAIVIVVLIGWRFYLQSTLDNVDIDIKKNQALIDRQDNDTIRKEVQKTNNTNTDYINFAANNPNWSKVLIGFSKLVPKEVVITSFNANTKSGKIDILGVGLTRDAVLQLRSNIDGSPLFKNINLPLENLQKSSNVLFNFTFYLADGALKL